MKRVDLICGALLSLSLNACGGGTATNSGNDLGTTNSDTCMTGKEKAVVLTKISFARQMPPGVTDGFDLDNYVAGPNDPKTCGHASFKNADGTPGIDNQFSSVVPAIEAQTNGAIDGEIQDAINGGMLLIGLDLQNVDSTKDDGCVSLTLLQLTGTPTVGTDKILDANQTFVAAKDGPVSKTQGAIKGGVLTAGPFEASVPVRILDANFNLAVHGARLKVTIADDGSATGVLGGTLKVQEVVDTLSKYAIGADLQRMLPDLLNSIADQDQDPMTMKCRQFSVAIDVSAKPAFIN